MPTCISAWAAAASSASLADLVKPSYRPLPGANAGYILPEANGIISAAREDVRAAQLCWLVRHWDLLMYRMTSSKVDIYPQKEWHAIMTMETHGKKATNASDSKAAARREQMRGMLTDCLDKGRHDASRQLFPCLLAILTILRASSIGTISTVRPHNGTDKSSICLFRSNPPSCARFSGR